MADVLFLFSHFFINFQFRLYFQQYNVTKRLLDSFGCFSVLHDVALHTGVCVLEFINKLSVYRKRLAMVGAGKNPYVENTVHVTQLLWKQELRKGCLTKRHSN